MRLSLARGSKLALIALLLGPGVYVAAQGINTAGSRGSSSATITGTDTDVCFYDGTAVACNQNALQFTKATGTLAATTFKVGTGGSVLDSGGTIKLVWYTGGDVRVGSDAGGAGLRFYAGNTNTAIVGTGNFQMFTGKLSITGTAPTCSASCGTSPAVTGSDSAMVVTMGATGVPASPFTVTFSSAWGTAPSCVAVAAKTGMVAGKAPILAVSSTTTVIVTTNGTAPSNSDVYTIHCEGVA